MNDPTGDVIALTRAVQDLTGVVCGLLARIGELERKADMPHERLEALEKAVVHDLNRLRSGI